jgi:hypothetical protein
MSYLRSGFQNGAVQLIPNGVNPEAEGNRWWGLLKWNGGAASVLRNNIIIETVNVSFDSIHLE